MQSRKGGSGQLRTAQTDLMPTMPRLGKSGQKTTHEPAADTINRTHDHTIPNLNLPAGFLEDKCDQGTLWDPTLSAYYYTFDASTQKFTAYDPSYPTAWLSFNGQWGDQEYPKSDPRQHFILPGVDATAKFTSGPNGPLFKQLNRKNVCTDYNNEPCIIRQALGP